ncbi:MAG TPA: PorV/PorQ family protein [Ignavibacteriaceae bacterium]|nr:PorV/PorQ family protein [Ignavibacteriaceae bacterium]
MIQIKKLLFVLLICTIAIVDAFAGGENRAGTAAAPELKIPVGSRYLGMGGSAVASATGLEAIYWNPAGVAVTNTSANAIFSYRKYIADMNMDYVAVSGSFEGFGTLALAFRSLNVGAIDVTTLAQPDGTGEQFTPSYFVIGVTYSRQLTDRISVGTTFNFINESWARVQANALSFDVGVQYRNLFDIDGLAVGVAVKNLGGSMKYEGSALWIQATAQGSQRPATFYQVGAASFELPSEISLGLAYSRHFDEDNSLSFAGTFVNNNFAYDEYRIGAEYNYQNMLYLRGGYMFSPNTADDNPNIFQDFSLGVGVNFKQFTDLDISLDYAYVPVKYFDANNAFTIRFGF